MAIEETFTDETSNGTGSTVSGNQIAIIDGSFTGTVELQALSPISGAGYVTLAGSVYDEPGAYPVICPDSDVTYRFVGTNIVGTARCYLGP